MTEPATHPELIRIREQIAEAVARNRPLSISGGATRSFYGQHFDGDPLSMLGYDGLIAYEPTELVVTVRSGTRVRDLQQALAEQGQFLPFEPPVFGPASTVGGMVATGLSGPRRASAGSVRDYVLGASMIDSAGQWLNFGGQVMKNVAGYDVSRLLCGSMGILGIIADLSIKVLPQPVAECTVLIQAEEADAIRLVNELAGQPVPLSASSWYQSQLHLRLSGAATAVEQAVERLVQSHSAATLGPADAGQYWQSVCDQQFEFFEPADKQAIWRLSVPSTSPVIDLPGEQWLEWGGALRWWRTDAPAHPIRAAAQAVGGSATLFRGGDKSQGVFEPLATPLLRIHQRLKKQLDPRGIFNRGRMYPDL